MLTFRPHTIDRVIYNWIYYVNEYRLPEAFEPDDIIVDIGGHAGYFAHRVLEKGCGKVVCVEAEPGNFELASNHLENFIAQGRAELLHAAVWRSDENNDELHHSGYTRFDEHDYVNTGGGDVLWNNTGEIIPKIAFDDLILRVTRNGKKRIRLLKLDCEGSEWPILLTSKYLHLIDEITGEFHEIGGAYDDLSVPFQIKGFQHFTEDLLRRYLTQKGFHIETKRNQDPESGVPCRLGMFYARTKDSGSKESGHLYQT